MGEGLDPSSKVTTGASDFEALERYLEVARGIPLRGSRQDDGELIRELEHSRPGWRFWILDGDECKRMAASFDAAVWDGAEVQEFYERELIAPVAAAFPWVGARILEALSSLRASLDRVGPSQLLVVAAQGAGADEGGIAADLEASVIGRNGPVITLVSGIGSVVATLVAFWPPAAWAVLIGFLLAVPAVGVGSFALVRLKRQHRVTLAGVVCGGHRSHLLGRRDHRRQSHFVEVAPTGRQHAGRLTVAATRS